MEPFESAYDNDFLNLIIMIFSNVLGVYHATGLNSQKETDKKVPWVGILISTDFLFMFSKLFQLTKIVNRVIVSSNNILEISRILKASERVLICCLQGIQSGTDYTYNSGLRPIEI